MVLLTDGEASPRATHECLGVLQWVCLANRGLRSCFSSVYEFVELLLCTSSQIVPPSNIIDEVFVCVFVCVCVCVCVCL